MYAVSAVILALCALQDDPVKTEVLKGFKHPWQGYGAGSTVTYRETLLRPQISKEGDLVYEGVEVETVWSLDGGRGEPMKLSIVGGGRESTFSLDTALPGWTRGKGEAKGEETLKVGEREFVCDVTSITFDGGGDAGQVTVLHRSKEAPTWAVRRRVETFVKGDRNTVEEERLVEIGRKVKVGSREVECVVVRVTVEKPGGAKTVHTEFRSDEVPGWIVRRETRHFQGDHEVKGSFTKKEVVTFSSRK